MKALALGATVDEREPRPRFVLTERRAQALRVLHAAALFIAFAWLFFLLLGRPPSQVLWAMLQGSLGSGFALSETLVRAAPILLCALATLLPARLGLISVGAEGQLVMGAIVGTGAVLALGERAGAATLPLVIGCGALGGAAWGALAGWLRARLHVNETICTLLLNYITPSLVDYLIYGAWKDPASLGWPATVSFPAVAKVPSFFDTRVHLGLVLGLLVLLAVQLLLRGTRLGLAVDLLRENPQLAERAGYSRARAIVLALGVGGALAGAAGFIEASALEGRLQAGVGAGAGYAGFLVAFLARGRVLSVLPLTLVVAALVSSGDNLQLQFDLPSSVVYVLQGLLFAAALVAGAPRSRRALAAEVR